MPPYLPKANPKTGPKPLQNIEHVLRQVLEYGFTQREVQRVKKELRAHLQKARDEETTRDSSDLAVDLLGSLGDNRVMRSAAQDEHLLVPMLEAITAGQILQAFIPNWSAGHRLVMVTGDVNFPKETKDPLARIKEVYTHSASLPVAKPEAAEAVVFPYLPDPPQGESIRMQTNIKDLAIDRVELGNGIHLVMKKTPFKSGEVLSTLSFGHGKASQPEGLPGLTDLAEAMLNEAGFGAMDRTDLDKALAGHPTRIRLHIREDVCEVVGQSVTEDLPLLFQLLYTFVSDPGYRPEALALVRNRLAQDYARAIHDVQGVMQINGQHFLSGGDSRFGLASPQDLTKITLDQIKTWFSTQLNNSTMEIAVVGDFDADVVRNQAQHYLGALPPRIPAGVPDISDKLPIFPEGRRVIFHTDSQIDKALVVVAYPTEDFWNIQRTRRLSVLASVFTERLRTSIREKLGAAYSPFAFNHSHRAYAGWGTFQIYLLVDPKESETVINEVMRIADTLGRQPVGPDEFRRSLDPTLTRIKDLRQSNTYWLHSVLSGSERHPRQLEWARTMEKDHAAITAEEIRQLAATYLINRKAAVCEHTVRGSIGCVQSQAENSAIGPSTRQATPA